MDYRREWIKRKVCDCLGLEITEDHDYFEDMLQAGDGELDDQLSAFLEDDISDEESEKRLFSIYRTSYDRLVDREILVPEVGMSEFDFDFHINTISNSNRSEETFISRRSSGGRRSQKEEKGGKGEKSKKEKER